MALIIIIGFLEIVLLIIINEINNMDKQSQSMNNKIINDETFINNDYKENIKNDINVNYSINN